jgi:maltooligosyltrehalose trehalohydrolase
LREFYHELIRWRKDLKPVALAEKSTLEVRSLDAAKVVWIRYWHGDEQICVFFCFATEPVSVRVDLPGRAWRRLLDSAEERWGGPGTRLPEEAVPEELIEFNFAPQSVALFQASGIWG